MKRQFIFLILFSMLLTSCAAKPAETPVLKFAVLPVLDVLPIYVADAQGYFAKEGIKVEFIKASSSMERDQLMQAGQVDGMLNEITSTMYYNRDNSQIHMVRYGRAATAEYAVFRLLAAKDSGIQSVNDLQGVPVAISEGTVIEYVTVRILEKAGFDMKQFSSIAVPGITDRMSLLASGELKAAVLPDPLASLAIQNGANVVIDDTSYPEISVSVYSFNNKTLEERPDDVKAFLVAVEQAVTDINADKTKWDTLLKEKQLVPEPLIGKYILPTFPTAGVPDEAQFEDALAWVKAKGLVQTDLEYGDSVDASFLPK